MRPLWTLRNRLVKIFWKFKLFTVAYTSYHCTLSLNDPSFFSNYFKEYFSEISIISWLINDYFAPIMRWFYNEVPTLKTTMDGHHHYTQSQTKSFNKTAINSNFSFDSAYDMLHILRWYLKWLRAVLHTLTMFGYNLLQKSMLYDKTSLVKDLNSAIESHQFETHFFTWIFRRLLSR